MMMMMMLERFSGGAHQEEFVPLSTHPQLLRICALELGRTPRHQRLGIFRGVTAQGGRRVCVCTPHNSTATPVSQFLSFSSKKRRVSCFFLSFFLDNTLSLSLPKGVIKKKKLTPPPLRIARASVSVERERAEKHTKPPRSLLRGVRCRGGVPLGEREPSDLKVSEGYVYQTPSLASCSGEKCLKSGLDRKHSRRMVFSSISSAKTRR